METQGGENNPPLKVHLTGVERARDESEQVLCELEDLPLAPFPAAHLCSWESGAWKGQHKKEDSGFKVKRKKRKKSKEDFYFDKVPRQGKRPLLSSTPLAVSAWPWCVAGVMIMSEWRAVRGLVLRACGCVCVCVCMYPGSSVLRGSRVRLSDQHGDVGCFFCQVINICLPAVYPLLSGEGGGACLSLSFFLPPTLTPPLL